MQESPSYSRLSSILKEFLTPQDTRILADELEELGIILDALQEESGSKNIATALEQFLTAIKNSQNTHAPSQFFPQQWGKNTFLDSIRTSINHLIWQFRARMTSWLLYLQSLRKQHRKNSEEKQRVKDHINQGTLKIGHIRRKLRRKAKKIMSLIEQSPSIGETEDSFRANNTNLPMPPDNISPAAITDAQMPSDPMQELSDTILQSIAEKFEDTSMQMLAMLLIKGQRSINAGTPPDVTSQDMYRFITEFLRTGTVPLRTRSHKKDSSAAISNPTSAQETPVRLYFSDQEVESATQALKEILETHLPSHLRGPTTNTPELYEHHNTPSDYIATDQEVLPHMSAATLAKQLSCEQQNIITIAKTYLEIYADGHWGNSTASEYSSALVFSISCELQQGNFFEHKLPFEIRDLYNTLSQEIHRFQQKHDISSDTPFHATDFHLYSSDFPSFHRLKKLTGRSSAQDVLELSPISISLAKKQSRREKFETSTQKSTYMFQRLSEWLNIERPYIWKPVDIQRSLSPSDYNFFLNFCQQKWSVIIAILRDEYAVDPKVLDGFFTGGIRQQELFEKFPEEEAFYIASRIENLKRQLAQELMQWPKEHIDHFTPQWIHEHAGSVSGGIAALRKKYENIPGWYEFIASLKPAWNFFVTTVYPNFPFQDYPHGIHKHKIQDLSTQYPDFAWKNFPNGLDVCWIDIFDVDRVSNLQDLADKLHYKIIGVQKEMRWSLFSLWKDHTDFMKQVYYQLASNNTSLQSFIQAIPQDTRQKRNHENDICNNNISKNFNGTLDQRKKFLVTYIHHLVQQSNNSCWNLQTLEGEHAGLCREIEYFGIKEILSNLSFDTLIKFEPPTITRLRFDILALQVEKYLKKQMRGQRWNLSSFSKSETLQTSIAKLSSDDFLKVYGRLPDDIRKLGTLENQNISSTTTNTLPSEVTTLIKDQFGVSKYQLSELQQLKSKSTQQLEGIIKKMEALFDTLKISTEAWFLINGNSVSGDTKKTQRINIEPHTSELRSFILRFVEREGTIKTDIFNTIEEAFENRETITKGKILLSKENCVMVLNVLSAIFSQILATDHK